MTKQKKIKVGITIGDYNGIGMEVIIKSLLDHRMLDFCTPVIYGSSHIASFYKKILRIKDFNVQVISDAEQATPQKNNLINCWNEELQIIPGKSDPQAGTFAVKSLKMATDDLARNKVDVLVTAPLNKKLAQSEHFNYPGQTEYLAAYAHEDHPIMLMVFENLRVGLLTTHVPIKEVPLKIDQTSIITLIKQFNHSLMRDFAVRKPKIAVLGLNPHSGDNGLLGDEEKAIIIPAIKTTCKEGIIAAGPFPADGFFGSCTWKHYDGVLAMYHDQGLAPFKSISSNEGVNYTANLPIVRTSPAHGTAYDIAGKGIASEKSMRNAIFTACKIYRTRREYKELHADVLSAK